MFNQGNIGPSGSVAIERTRNLGPLKSIRPAPFAWKLRNWLSNRVRELPALVVYRLLGALFGLVYFESCLRAIVKHADGTITDYGVVSRRVVTTAGVNFLVDALQGTVEPEILRYHGFGTGSTAEASGDTALVTELTTQYASDSTRPTGSQTEGASANIFRTVATLSPDSGGTINVTEHGIFSQAATGGGTLLDRSVFTAIPVVASADSLQVTYDLTLAAGS